MAQIDLNHCYLMENRLRLSRNGDTWVFILYLAKVFLFNENDLRLFHSASNTILSVLDEPNESVQLHFLYADCVPIISYGCTVKQFSARGMMQCDTAINNCIREIFLF